MRPVNRLRFGEVTYMRSQHLYQDNVGASNALAAYLRDSRGLQAEAIGWHQNQKGCDGDHRFVLAGKELRTVKKVRDEFEKSVDLLRQYAFEGRGWSDAMGKPYPENLEPAKPWQMEDFVKNIQSSAEKARKTTIDVLKKARIWEFKGDTSNNFDAPHFRQNLMTPSLAKDIMARVFPTPSH